MSKIPQTITNHFADATDRPRVTQVFANGHWQSFALEVNPTWDAIWAYKNMGVSTIAVTAGDRTADFTMGELTREANRPALSSAPRR